MGSSLIQYMYAPLLHGQHTAPGNRFEGGNTTSRLQQTFLVEPTAGKHTTAKTVSN